MEFLINDTTNEFKWNNTQMFTESPGELLQVCRCSTDRRRLIYEALLSSGRGVVRLLGIKAFLKAVILVGGGTEWLSIPFPWLDSSGAGRNDCCFWFEETMCWKASLCTVCVPGESLACEKWPVPCLPATPHHAAVLLRSCLCCSSTWWGINKRTQRTQTMTVSSSLR